MSAVKKLISFDEGIAHELEVVASALQMTQREVVERALDFYFDHTDALVAEKISEDIKAGREGVQDADEVFERLGLA